MQGKFQALIIAELCLEAAWTLGDTPAKLLTRLRRRTAIYEFLRQSPRILQKNVCLVDDNNEILAEATEWIAEAKIAHIKLSQNIRPAQTKGRKNHVGGFGNGGGLVGLPEELAGEESERTTPLCLGSIGTVEPNLLSHQKFEKQTPSTPDQSSSRLCCYLSRVKGLPRKTNDPPSPSALVIVPVSLVFTFTETFLDLCDCNLAFGTNQNVINVDENT